MTEQNETPLVKPTVKAQEDEKFETSLEKHDAELDKAYKKALKVTIEPEALKLSINDIPKEKWEERITGLENKLKEYNDRLKTKQSDDPLLPYKRDITRFLLKEVTLNIWAFARARAEVDPHSSTEKVNDAFRIIHDYITTGGKNVIGGTGLTPQKA